MKKLFTIRVDDAVLDHFRNLVFWTPGATLGEEVELAMIQYLESEEKHRGAPFEPRTKDKLCRHGK